MRRLSLRTLGPAVASVAAAFLIAGAAHAGGTVNLQDTIGSGPNTSYFVLDFGTPSSPNAFAFAYDWSAPQTDGGLIDALASANVGFSDTSTVFTFGVTSERFFDSFTYAGNTFSDQTDPFGFWNFWTSNDGVNWSSPVDGADDVPLSDGSWEGWTWVPNFETDTAEPPSTPFLSAAATPEPGAAALMLIGGSAGFLFVRRPRGRRVAA